MARTYQFDVGPVVEQLNRILQMELAAVIYYTHYSFMIYGHARIPITSWLRDNATESLARTYLLPPLSFGGASLVQPWLRFHAHRVTGGGRPPPVPTERGVRISRTNALRKLVHSTASACSSEYGRRSLGVSNGVRSLIWLKASQVRRRPAQLRLHNIRRP